MNDPRSVIIRRLETDLIGPKEAEELIDDRPTDRYLTGILFPQRSVLSPDEDDEAGEVGEPKDIGTGLDGIKASSQFRPSSAGLSFAVLPTGDTPVLKVTVNSARYVREVIDADEEGGTPAKKKWRRVPKQADLLLDIVALKANDLPVQDLGESGLSGASLHIRRAEWGDTLLVTLVLTNDKRPTKDRNREATEEAALFQVSASVECEQDCHFAPKPNRSAHSVDGDDDARSSALLYRNARQFAVGHTCSANWGDIVEDTVDLVETSWFPMTIVYETSAKGDDEFQTDTSKTALSAEWLAGTDAETLVSGLSAFIDAYGTWISKTEAGLGDLPESHLEQGRLHLTNCRDAKARMRKGIELLNSSPQVLNAFRLANSALSLQYSWRDDPYPSRLTWRPFQLGFALLCLESLANPSSTDREAMDLLWFPTGGGKTEAYLLLTAFTIFLRRIRAKGDPGGAGVTSFMRYTLRLLTIQQFERAASLITACELIRLGQAPTGAAVLPSHFTNDAPISLGLWVGAAATPNTVKDAESALNSNGESSPAQLKQCPVCKKELDWAADPDVTRIEVRCANEACILSSVIDSLPVWTVDEDIYREQPTLVIATVDKYAQIVRKAETASLFGAEKAANPPELIIQDELHLISGPLGSLAGLYEAAIDELCRTEAKQRVKIIGSTATIRRAQSQIGALFDRRSFQFPPPGLDYSNSGFAVENRDAPGRLYVGVTTVGRSAKYTQQAVVASLLQGATDRNLTDEERDGYWTLVNYFNSLRELGGALSLMRDDVMRSIADYAERHGEEKTKRDADTQIELTSRVNSSEIPRFLKDLERAWEDDDHIDVVLASNMISVGMDVSRLGLMVVNGQPKTIAEYIQATSRVGRSNRAPGLVLTLFNAAKSRDRSRYETFISWHESFYRDVEATSVTPFAPRARDRALHAPLVAMIRHLVDGMESAPGALEDHEDEARLLLGRLVERIERLDYDEAQDAREQLEDFFDGWLDNTGLSHYWHDYDDALLMSAEAAAERGRRFRNSRKKPTPNSLRSVEASSSFVLLNYSKPRETSQ